MSILIVEDDYFVAVQMQAALSEAGLESAGIATTAEEAIELAASQHPALAVIDIRLASARDGIDAAIVLLREHGIRCIFATAHHDVHTRARAALASPLGWLQKPYSMQSLVQVVRNTLKGLDGRTH
jgi:two-component system, response regulator PdtaR